MMNGAKEKNRMMKFKDKIVIISQILFFFVKNLLD